MEQIARQLIQVFIIFAGVIFVAMALWRYERKKAKRLAQEEAFDRPAPRKAKVIEATHKRGKR